MLDLAQRYWDWRERLDEKRRMYSLYGSYMRKAATLLTINRPVDKQCTQMFIRCIDSGLKTVRCDSYYCTATFENGYKVKFWIENKMYAYAQDAEFISPTGEKLSFNRVMPDKWCLFYILDKIENAKINA